MKRKVASLIENWWIYAVMILLGVPVGNAVSPEKMLQALLVIGTVILTALIATLLVPFAGFSKSEGWQKFAVQYGAVPTFGTYGALLYSWAGWWGMLLVVPPLVVHAGYWQSSIHSRQYRLDLFRLAYAERMPYTSQLLCILSARGAQHISDDIIKLLLMHTGKLDLEYVESLLDCENRNLILSAAAEIETQMDYLMSKTPQQVD